MPLLISCPACAAKLKVPDHLAGTGKSVKCPRCQEKIPVDQPKPADLGVDREASRPQPKAKAAPPVKKRSREDDDEEPVPKKRRRDEEDEDSPRDEDEEAPPPKKRRRDEEDEDDERDQDERPSKKRRPVEEDEEDTRDEEAEPAPRKRRRPEEDEEHDRDKDDDEPRPKKRRKSANLEDSNLLAESSWMLRRNEGIFHRIKPYRCEFFRPGTKNMVGVVEEKCNRVLKMLFGGVPVIGRFQSIHLEVRDEDGGPVLFTVRIPGLKFFRFSLLSVLGVKEKRVDLLDADGEMVCSFVMKLLSLTPNFNVFDPEDEKIAEFRFKTLDMRKSKGPRMVLSSAEGEEWGMVTGEEEADMMKAFAEGKRVKVSVKFMPQKAGLLITVNTQAADQMMAKRLLLSAAVAMRVFRVYKIFMQT